MTIQALLDLKERINQIDDTYLVRFTVANKDLSDVDFEARFKQDQADRLDAFNREEKRKKILFGDVSQLSDEEFNQMVEARNAKIIQVDGVGATGQTSNANTTTE